jgi:hypothetical protein
LIPELYRLFYIGAAAEPGAVTGNSTYWAEHLRGMVPSPELLRRRLSNPNCDAADAGGGAIELHDEGIK